MTSNLKWESSDTPEACRRRWKILFVSAALVPLRGTSAAAEEHTLCYSVRCTPCNVRIDICHPHVNGRASLLRAPRPSRTVLLRRTKGSVLAAPSVALFRSTFVTCQRPIGRTIGRQRTRWIQRTGRPLNHVAPLTLRKGRGPPLPIP